MVTTAREHAETKQLQQDLSACRLSRLSQSEKRFELRNMVEVARTAGSALCVDQRWQVEDSEPDVERLDLNRSRETLFVITDAFDDVQGVNQSFVRRQCHQWGDSELSFIHEEGQPAFNPSRVRVPLCQNCREFLEILTGLVIADVDVVGHAPRPMRGGGESANNDEIDSHSFQALQNGREAHGSSRWCRDRLRGFVSVAFLIAPMKRELLSSRSRRFAGVSLKPSRSELRSTPYAFARASTSHTVSW